MERDDDHCEAPRCRQGAQMEYIGHRICDRCWGRHCREEINLDKIFKVQDYAKGER